MRAFAQRLLVVAAAGVAALGCDSDDIPKGPDLVVCNCHCETTTPTGSNTPDGCPPRPTCDPSCGDLQCTMSGACVGQCSGTPQLTTIGSDKDVPLRICIDSNDSQLVARACQERCDGYASGDARQCVSALLNQLGLADEVSDVVPDAILPRVSPDSAQSVADIIVEECGTWLSDSLTGTCGVSTQGLEALKDLLFCFWSPTDPFNIQTPSKFRQCFPTGSELFKQNGCPEYTRKPEGTPVDDGALAATEEVSTQSSAITIAGPDVETVTVKPSGFASTGRIGPIVLMSQLDVTLPSTTLSIKDHDVPLEGATFFLERPIAAVLTTGDALSIAPGKIQAILSGALNGSNTSVGATNTTALTGHYNEATGVFDLKGTFQLSGLDATFEMSLGLLYVNRPPRANAGPDQVVECGLQTREAAVQLSAGDSADPDPGDRIARYVWTAGHLLVSDGPTASMAVAQLGLGTRVATLTTIDTHGSMSRDTALIKVVDTQTPVFPPLPPVINSLCQPGVDEVRIPTPVVTDACSPSVSVTGAVVALNGTAVTPVPIVDQTLQLGAGTYQVEWTATDQSGNSVKAQQTLIVRGGIQVSQAIDVKDRASVRGPGGSYATVLNTGTGEVELGVEASTGSLLARGDVTLRNRSIVNGDVVLAGRYITQARPTVTGTATENPALTLPPGRDLSGVTFPPLNQGVYLESKGAQTIVPGAYSALVVKPNASLTLSSGTYFVGSFDLEPGAELRLMQPVQLYVSTSMVDRGGLVTVSGSASDFVLGFAGNQTVFLDAPFPGGALVAPNAKIVIGSLGADAFTGQLSVKELQVHPGATVTCGAVAGSVPMP